MTKKIKKVFIWAFVLVIVAYAVFLIAAAPKIPQSDIVSQNGLHWHAHVAIKINGENISIPAGIGTTGPTGSNGEPTELHTHETDGIIHAEFAGVVTKEQLELKHFFEVWGKDFSKDSILGNKAGNGHTITMFVNGKPNTDFENYSITGLGTFDSHGDGNIDDIEIIYQ